MVAAAREIEIELGRLYEAQHEAVYHPARYVVIEASTKAGKTHGCLTWQLSRVLMDAGIHWWVAPVYAQAKIAYSRAQKMIPRQLRKLNQTELSITLVNGSIWTFKSGEKPDNLYGDDVRSAVVDEASRMREASWVAVRSTLTATRGPVRLIGNVRGRKNWHYAMARRAAAGEQDHHYVKLTAWDAVAGGVIDRAEVEDAQRVLPEHVFRELYLAEPTDDGSNPFGLDAIEACILARKPKGAPEVWGWDLAKKVDWTVGIGLDAAGHVARMERWQKRPWPWTKKQIATLTGESYALIDSTGLGDTILDDLQIQDHMHVEGFVFSGRSKQQLMEELAEAIQAGEVRFEEGVLADELREMEYAYTRTGVTYSAPEGQHDDCVMALALANRARRQRRRVGAVIPATVRRGRVAKRSRA